MAQNAPEMLRALTRDILSDHPQLESAVPSLTRAIAALEACEYTYDQLAQFKSEYRKSIGLDVSFTKLGEVLDGEY